MSWEIDREGLHTFIDKAIDEISSKPMPPEIVEALIVTDAPDVIRDATYGAWIASGVAILIGEEIRDNPERFLIESP